MRTEKTNRMPTATPQPARGRPEKTESACHNTSNPATEIAARMPPMMAMSIRKAAARSPASASSTCNSTPSGVRMARSRRLLWPPSCRLACSEIAMAILSMPDQAEIAEPEQEGAATDRKARIGVEDQLPAKPFQSARHQQHDDGTQGHQSRLATALRQIIEP